MARTFVVVGHRAATGPDFRLEDLPGSGGRLDVLLRCINSAFLLSHGLRRDVTVYLVLLGPPDAPRTLRLTGASLKHLNPDERSTGALVRKALQLPLAGSMWRTSTPGIEVSRRGLADLREELGDAPVLLLDEAGEDVEASTVPADPVLVLSDHQDLDAGERALLDDWGARALSLGARSYHADHCITTMHWILDRREGAT